MTLFKVKNILLSMFILCLCTAISSSALADDSQISGQSGRLSGTVNTIDNTETQIIFNIDGDTYILDRQDAASALGTAVIRVGDGIIFSFKILNNQKKIFEMHKIVPNNSRPEPL